VVTDAKVRLTYNSIIAISCAVYTANPAEPIYEPRLCPNWRLIFAVVASGEGDPAEEDGLQASSSPPKGSIGFHCQGLRELLPATCPHNEFAIRKGNLSSRKLSLVPMKETAVRSLLTSTSASYWATSFTLATPRA
jgi:hypothetical protein